MVVIVELCKKKNGRLECRPSKALTTTDNRAKKLIFFVDFPSIFPPNHQHTFVRYQAPDSGNLHCT